MSSTQSGATIRYTTNGSTPTASSTAYSGAIPISQTTTVKAKAFHSSYNTSAETARTYTMSAATPTLSVAAGSYAPGDVVTISTTEPTATLRMTIDGNDPTSTSPVVASGTTLILGNFTLKVKAFRSGVGDSAVASAAYTLTSALGPGAVTTGGAHNVLATPDGRVYVWGNNGNGQLGNESTTDRQTPTLINTITGVKAVASGLAHTLALLADGQVYAWGSNGSGRLGNSSTDQSTKPVHVSTLSNVVAIAAGDTHSLALTSGGQVYSWGANSTGQLGLGDYGTGTERIVPTQITSLSNIVSIAAGDSQSFAVTSGGQVFAWGANGNSRLGDGGTTQQNSPLLLGLSNIVSIAAGQAHTLALTSGGRVYGFGANSNGQLGIAATATVATPTLIPNLHVSAIAAGDNHSGVIRADGALVMFGNSSSGQVGSGSITATIATPTVITGVTSASTLSLGDLHSAAVTSTGEVFTWGESADYRLGNNATSPDKSSPQSILTGLTSWAPAAPTINVASGTLGATTTVTLTSSTSGAAIRYTLNGSLPTASDAEVPTNGQIEISYSSLLRARAFASGRQAVVAPARADYELQSAAPVISPGTGTYGSAQTVSITATGAPGAIRYTLDGSEPTTSSLLYSTPLGVSTGTMIKAKTFPSNGWAPSSSAAATLSFDYGTLATPTASPGAGVFGSAQSITLAGPSGATIHYTIDGTEPTSSSNLYASPFSVNTGTVTVKARAFHSDWSQSAVLSSTYTIDTTAPTVTAAVWPRPNSAGWNNTPVTVTFQCSDNIAIASCPAAVIVSSDGAGQVVQRIASDTAGNAASALVSINLDTVAPVVTLTAPSNGSSTTATTVTATGTAGDALSGLAAVGCNGDTQSASTTISCSIPLRPGRNAVVVHVSDVAGNTASAGAYVSRTGTATHLFVTPTDRTLVVGGTATLALHDEFGAEVSQATWTSSDTDVVTVSSDDPPVLTAISAGTAAITVTKGGLTASANLTAVLATAVVDGLPQWNVAPTAGLTMERPIFANVASEFAPDLFVVESVSSTETKIRGAKVSGEVISTETVPGLPLMGDSFGGLIFGIPETGSNEFFRAIVRTGADSPWRYDGFISWFMPPAQAPDGTIYAVEYVDGGIIDGAQFWDAQAIVIDGSTGRLLQRTPIKAELTSFTAALAGQTISGVTCQHTLEARRPEIVGPFVGQDGRGYMLVSRRNMQMFGNCMAGMLPERIDDVGLDLLVLSATSAPTTTSVYARQCTLAQGQRSLCDILPSGVELDAMPDGLGGTLIKWQRVTAIAGGDPYQYEHLITRFDSDLEAAYSVESSAYLLATSQSGLVMASVDGAYAAINATDFNTSWTASWTAGSPVAISANGASFLDESGALNTLSAGQLIQSINVGVTNVLYYRGALLGINSSGLRSTFLASRIVDTTLFEQGSGNPQGQKGPRRICGSCTKDYIPPDGHGPVSSTDARRIVHIMIDSDWDDEFFPFLTNERIKLATECAVSQWNSARDAFGNRTGFFWKLEPYFANPDVVIRKRTAGGFILAAINGGADQRPQSDLQLHELIAASSTIQDQDNCGRIAHELAHKMGGAANWSADPLCSVSAVWSILDGRNDNGTRVVNTVRAIDVELVNQALMYPGTCTATDPAQDYTEPIKQ